MTSPITVQFTEQISDTEQPPKKQKPRLTRTLSRTFTHQKQKKESPPSTDWKTAKKLWPSSTGGVTNNNDYQKLKFTYCQIYPYLVSTEKSIEAIFEEIEYRTTLQKLNVEWICSNSTQSFEKFAQENSLWQNFLKNRTP